MTKLPSINLDVLKRPRVLLAIGGVLVLILLFWFAWWSPESGKLASVQGQKQRQAQEITQLNDEYVQLQTEGKYISQYQTYLTFFSSQVPIQPEEGQLVFDLGALSIKHHVDLTSVSANTVVPATPPATISTIPVVLTVTGGHSNVFSFLNALYSLPRLITIQNITPSPTGNVSTSYNVLAHDGVAFSLTITGTAYFSGTVAPTPAG